MSAEGDRYSALRERMVLRQIKGRGVSDERVLAAFMKVERHRFTLPEFARDAYEDEPLPIGDGQTISQPYMVALMTEALDLGGGERVLEVGTGSGYQAAILAELAAEVYTIERNEALAKRAGETLSTLGYSTVRMRVGDGTLGWPEHAPYQGIVVTAGGPSVPESLKSQLDPNGGVMVMPVGGRMIQSLVKVKRNGEEYETEDLGSCRFVPLVGQEGW